MSGAYAQALNESLKTLETLMNEFFDENTSNDRKREIEISLNDFNNEQGVWRHCLYFLSNTQNEYVMMFCLNVLENIIKEQWISMLGTEKGEIRSATYQYLLACHQNVPLSIRNKLGKLNVDIGRLDWPHFYPEFFSNILQLVQSTETASLGLMLLQTVSEEFAFPRDDISISRKEELYRLLAEQVPNILNVVGGLLDLVLEKHHCLATATPPPSPTHGQDSDLSPFNTSLYPGSLLHSMFKSLSNKNLSQSIPILDTESYQLCVQGLNCLSHFFSWIPLSMHINSSLLTTIFQFASFGCDSLLSHNQTMTGKDIQSTLKKGELGMLAMGCINEIMSRNCIPSNFDDFLLQMSQYTFYLLQQLTKDENTTSSTNNNRLLELDENYIEKFTDFLRLFVNIHLQRFESNAQFSVIEFLSLLFKYTFLQPTHTGFFSCLEIWGTFLDYLTIQLKNNPSNHSAIINRNPISYKSFQSQPDMCKVPEKIAHSACHLLKSVTSVIRPSFLCNLESIQQLYAIVCQGKLNLPLESQKLVHRSISNILLLPWPNVSNDEQQWESRYSRFEEFVKSITSSFRQIQHAPNFSIDKYVQEQAKPVIKWTISLLHDMIVNFLEATTKTKQLCFKALQENIEIAVSLVPIYLNFPDVGEDILDFFLMALKVFKSQMGIAFVEQTIQKFLSLFTRDQLTDCILREGSAGCHVVEKFLEVLQQIVKDPVPGFRSFLISILNFCMNDIYPIVADSQSFEIKQVLFELLYQILVNNWRFFFKSDIVSNLSRPGNDTIENIDYFTKIMEAYGQTFLQHDITLFRQNLQALENLNNKWKLYHKTLFKNLMINQFLNVLLQALIYKSHELLYDDICITIYNMASVNFENFYTVFLPHFLENCSGLDNSQKSILGQNFKYEKDLPTFTQILHRFINDLRYYHLCNRSLPLGSLGL
ncbi:exportin-6-like [Centruroides sculpturatus]|uniref:exportin-6-like n=1 Tax=Centruroides sculpturatus TaxID=218467 RepID=UPI000C6E4128|nr:exportin-6-like [Centruroides sculpturatus]